MTLRVAITGVSGDAGRGAMRGLRRNPPGSEPIWIVGLNAGHCVDPDLNLCVQLPLVHEPEYVDALAATLRQHDIHVLLPCIDAEIAVLSAARERIARTGTSLVIAPSELVDAADDKLTTARFLKARGIGTPATCDAAAGEPPGFPAVAKPRKGHGSQGLIFLPDQAAWHTFMQTRPRNYCLQRYVAGPEFTVGFLYNSEGVMCDAIAMERTLENGRTVRARLAESPELRKFMAKFGERVPGIGAVNAQLRLDENDGPLVFEINARLSGSTEMRVAVGCNDPLRLARHFGRGEPIMRASPSTGTVYRRGRDLWVDPC